LRRAARQLALVFGIAAGGASIEHGYFETRWGNVRPDSIMIASMGPPCQPEQIWNACEPAMTILPNMFVTGLLAISIGILVLIWSVGFVHKKHGGLILIGLSILMLLFGGGIFPPLIGIIGGVVGTRINAPVKKLQVSRSGRLLAKLWPWPLAAFGVWLVGQWVVGYFFNEFMLKSAYINLFLILGLLALTVIIAPLYDRSRADLSNQ
jgi:hypothetical protein